MKESANNIYITYQDSGTYLLVVNKSTFGYVTGGTDHIAGFGASLPVLEDNALAYADSTGTLFFTDRNKISGSPSQYEYRLFKRDIITVTDTKLFTSPKTNYVISTSPNIIDVMGSDRYIVLHTAADYTPASSTSWNAVYYTTVIDLSNGSFYTVQRNNQFTTDGNCEVALYKNGKIYITTNFRMEYFDTVNNTFNSNGTTWLGDVTALSDDLKYLGGVFNDTVDNYIAVAKFPDSINILIQCANSFTPRANTKSYAVVIYDNALSNIPAPDITAVANAFNGKGLKCIWLGNTGNQTVGQSIAAQTGGVYIPYTTYNNAISSLNSYLISQLPPKSSMYVVNVKKGDAIAYDKYYFDIEGDPQIPATLQWYYRHIPGADGAAAFANQWLSSPVTVFDKNGIYYVSWRVQDNPKPADTNPSFASYRKYPVMEEMMIMVGDAEPPAIQTVNPTLKLNISGSLKQNRKVIAELDVTPGTNDIDYSKTTWTYTAVSGGTGSDIKTKDISALVKNLLYKKAGTYHIKTTIQDVKGNNFSAETDVVIVPDQPITGSVTANPYILYRDAAGKAKTAITAQFTSPDDFIQSIKYYYAYDSDNDGSFADETVSELPQFQNLLSFDYDVLQGVGNYELIASAVEGFKEETIPEFVAAADYSTLTITKNITVDNMSPDCRIGMDKSVYLVGENINYISLFSGVYLNGDYSKGYIDPENDGIIDFNVRYVQDKTIMPIQDGTSAYNNVNRAELLEALDKAGRYTLTMSAADDPKNGDARFSSFRKASSPYSAGIIVHRPPVAAAAFSASHPTETNYSFGSNIYLEGTVLRIYDASSDPDGYAVATALSYKVDGGNYTAINAGDPITLAYGSIITVKVDTTDNWGAADTALYTITTVNDLDMVPEVIPSSVPASEKVTLRLTTNQYALSARAIIFGQNVSLPLKSQTASQKIWEIDYTIPAAKPDAVYTAQFYAVSEGLAELRKDKSFEVSTPINLVPVMPASFFINDTISITAVTTRYADSTKVTLFKGTPYETVLNMSGTPEGSGKKWTVPYTVPDNIPEGNYTAEFRATTPNGNYDVKNASFALRVLKITGGVNCRVLESLEGTGGYVRQADVR